MKKHLIFAFALILFCSISESIFSKNIFFVKENSSGNGETWESASGNIQTMIDKSAKGDEIWVAKGTYYPTTETIARDSRSRSFVLKDGVSVYGGFNGTETNIAQRVLSDLDGNGKIESFEFVNESVLSGDIDGVIDIWTKNMNADGKTWFWSVVGNEGNSYHVVTSSNSYSVMNYFNGFTVINGNANIAPNTTAGGIYASIFNISNCTVKYCSSLGDCGGVYSGFDVKNCKVTNCRTSAGSGGGIGGWNAVNCNVKECSASGSGGGIFSDNVDSCEVTDCSASGAGGGISLSDFSSKSSVNNCKVTNCSSKGNGGGVSSPFSVNNCLISNCISVSGYGGGILAGMSVNNCIVSNCTSKYYGGGIYVPSNIYKVSNCTVMYCKGNLGGGIFASFVEDCDVSYCSSLYYGGGIYITGDINFTFDPIFVKKCKVNNCSSQNGGGIFVKNTSKVYSTSIIMCTVSNCTASELGGGIYLSSWSNFTYLTNCFVENCSSSYGGGGIYSYSNGQNTYITNNVVRNCSTSGSGGGINAYSALLKNCTISNCSSSNNGGGIYLSALNSTINNCIVYNCNSRSGVGGGIFSSPTSTVSNCAIGNNFSNDTLSNISGGVQVGNISPEIQNEFIKPTSSIGIAISDTQQVEMQESNWRLKKGSICINTGATLDLGYNYNTAVGDEVDIDGMKRVQYQIIDIGAYEYSIPQAQLPAIECFNDWTNFANSDLLCKSVTLSESNSNKWEILNQKAVFSWKSNFTTTYNQSFFSYKIDATKESKVFLLYDLYYEAYKGTISPLGTEKLSIDYSTNFETWTPITSYSNINGTIPNKKYTHDLSSFVAGKSFYIRFNANGINSNRIEKWEIDNIELNTNGITNQKQVQKDKPFLISTTNNNIRFSNVLGTLIRVYDVAGKKLFEKKNSQYNEYISVSKQGLYLVKVDDFSAKVMIK